jgi:hypothetical protein
MLRTASTGFGSAARLSALSLDHQSHGSSDDSAFHSHGRQFCDRALIGLCAGPFPPGSMSRVRYWPSKDRRQRTAKAAIS